MNSVHGRNSSGRPLAATVRYGPLGGFAGIARLNFIRKPRVSDGVIITAMGGDTWLGPSGRPLPCSHVGTHMPDCLERFRDMNSATIVRHFQPVDPAMWVPT